MKRRIVLSGVNLIEGGPLSIFQDALHSLSASFTDSFDVIALVSRRDLFDIPGITFVEFPNIKRSWVRRVWFEYWQCRSLSRQINPYLWFSLHDMTPPVTAKRQAVYCHNPAPFYKLRLRDAALDWKFTLFSLFYKFLYRLFIHRNNFVVVQQAWMRQEFRDRYKAKNVVVAHPSLRRSPVSLVHKLPDGECRFFYPAFPRSFKNVELLLQAARLLEQRGVASCVIHLTFEGNENPYARSLKAEFGTLRSVRWRGVLSREQVMQEYASTNCLIFPSFLETWGLPISEFMQFGKAILVADLPYARETVGSYHSVLFIDPEDAPALASAMERFAAGELRLMKVTAPQIDAPFSSNWDELFHLLLDDDPSPQAANQEYPAQI